MLYLGIDTQYTIAHHNIFFSKDYKGNVEDIVSNKGLTEDFSFYVQNPWKTDSTLAPAGHSTLYVLVPVPNLTANTDWSKIQTEYTEKVLQALEKRAGLEDIRQHIKIQKVITPLNWQDDANVYQGAVFNMGHNIMQMLHRRPHNKYEDLEHCYLVGGGTHPGSGLPTIMESGNIAANLIEKYEQ